MNKLTTHTATLLSTLALAFALTGCCGGSADTGASAPTTPKVAKKAKFSEGDDVLAKWSTSYWVGTVQGECDKGFDVKWKSDGNVKCIASADVLPNKSAKKSDVKKGARVLAPWKSGSAYYEAKVKKVDGKKVEVEYVSDGSEEQLERKALRTF